MKRFASKYAPLLAGGMFLLATGASYAQDSSYQVGEARQARRTETTSKRLARFEYINGDVTWRPDENASWRKASRNQPLQPGAQIWATNGGRAEIRFDDGAVLRLGNNAIVTLQTLYSDTQGASTGLRMQAGLATLRLTRGQSTYTIDTPFASVRAEGPARVRLGVADDTEVGVSLGRATVENAQGSTTIHAGSLLVANDDKSDFDTRSLPRPDSWERWNDERDALLIRKDAPRTVYAPVYAPVPPVVVAPGPSYGINLDFVFGSRYRPRSWGRGYRWHR